MLKKIGKTKRVSDELLKEIVFYLNAHRQRVQGSPHERFFRRGVRNRLPNSIDREIDHRVLIARRHEKQIKLAQMKGRSAADVFEENDKVLLQDPVTKRWSKEATVVGKRTAEDGSTQSYEIQLESGNVSIRNKKYIKHASAQLPRGKKVRFADTPNDSEAHSLAAVIHADQTQEVREQEQGPAYRTIDMTLSL